MARRGDPRSTAQWRRICKAILAEATHCAICGGELDFTAPARTRWSPSVDHLVPLNHGGDPFAGGNLRPAHYGCNSARHDDAGPMLVSRNSREW